MSEVESSPATGTPTATVTPAPTTPGVTPTQTTTPATPFVAPDTAATIAQLQGDLASANARIKELNSENSKHRRRADEAQGVAETDAQLFDSLKKLGKPEEIQTALQERDALKSQVETLQRDQELRDVAEAAGFKFSVLRDRDNAARNDKGERALTYEVRDEKQGNSNTTLRVPYVKYLQDGKEKEAKLSEYAEANWSDYLPALRKEAPRVSGPGASPTPSGGNAPSHNQSHNQSGPPRRLGFL